MHIQKMNLYPGYYNKLILLHVVQGACADLEGLWGSLGLFKPLAPPPLKKFKGNISKICLGPLPPPWKLKYPADPPPFHEKISGSAHGCL